MPSRAYTSFLRPERRFMISTDNKCQCPLGLIPHFYGTITRTMISRKYSVSMPSRAYISFLRGWYCPEANQGNIGVNALSGLYLISTCNRPRLLHGKGIVSMPSRAYTSFLRYPFKNLGFMRFPEPVFAGICQNILTTAIFRAC